MSIGGGCADRVHEGPSSKGAPVGQPDGRTKNTLVSLCRGLKQPRDRVPSQILKVGLRPSPVSTINPESVSPIKNGEDYFTPNGLFSRASSVGVEGMVQYRDFSRFDHRSLERKVEWCNCVHVATTNGGEELSKGLTSRGLSHRPDPFGLSLSKARIGQWRKSGSTSSPRTGGAARHERRGGLPRTGNRRGRSRPTESTSVRAASTSRRS